jgi:5-(aminomethyl)-3-furanmethanol phosphate kinase
MNRELRVVKLGGSLLAQAGCTMNLKDWLSIQPCMTTILIVGGGASVEQLRGQQQALGLTDEQAHFAAVDRMVENSAQLIREFPEAHLISELISFANTSPSLASSAGLYFFDSRDWSRSNRELPRNWTMTSDSIAAAICSELAASELVLLKSTLPVSSNPVEIAESEIVDTEFRNWISRLPNLRIVNLASRPFSEVVAKRLADYCEVGFKSV